jgi:predicted transcriptional regulator
MEKDMPDLLELTTHIVVAHVANNTLSTTDLPALITRVHGALASLGAQAAPAVVVQAPAVSIKLSVKPDFIVCLECGKKLKMLKRHLSSDHGLVVADYRTKWGLSDNYPLVAPNYSVVRRQLAVSTGLGHTGGRRKIGIVTS